MELILEFRTPTLATRRVHYNNNILYRYSDENKISWNILKEQGMIPLIKEQHTLEGLYQEYLKDFTPEQYNNVLINTFNTKEFTTVKSNLLYYRKLDTQYQICEFNTDTNQFDYTYVDKLPKHYKLSTLRNNLSHYTTYLKEHTKELVKEDTESYKILTDLFDQVDNTIKKIPEDDFL